MYTFRLKALVWVALAAMLGAATIYAASAGTLGADCRFNCSRNNSGGENSKAAVIQNLFNAFQRGVQQGEQDNQNQMQQQLEQRAEEERQAQEQVNRDINTLTHAQSQSACLAIRTPSLIQRCNERFEFKRQQEQQEAIDEEARKKSLNAAPEKISDEILAGFKSTEPVNPAVTKYELQSKPPKSANDKKKVDRCHQTDPKTGDLCITATSPRAEKPKSTAGGYTMMYIITFKNTCDFTTSVSADAVGAAKGSVHRGTGIGPYSTVDLTCGTYPGKAESCTGLTKPKFACY